jgi:sec-independent protein translocase protein TatA
MPNVGPMELAIVLVVALIVLGPKRLPEVGRSLGNGIREFKDSLSNESHHEQVDDDDDDDAQLEVEEPPKPVTTAAATAPAPPADESKS